MGRAAFICPYCNCSMVVTSENQEITETNLRLKEDNQVKKLTCEHLVCSNPECGKATIFLTVTMYRGDVNGAVYIGANNQIFTQRIIPPMNVKAVPPCVPEPLAADYREACQIRELSPKAAATLVRRCLQGMIRDFWGVKRGKLAEEIMAIQDRVDPNTWAAIDSIRSIGNIGAHMEKDINLIIDVEPQEVELLINLVESLFDEWYVNREKRRERNQRIVDIRDNKEALRHPGSSMAHVTRKPES